MIIHVEVIRVEVAAAFKYLIVAGTEYQIAYIMEIHPRLDLVARVEGVDLLQKVVRVRLVSCPAQCAVADIRRGNTVPVQVGILVAYIGAKLISYFLAAMLKPHEHGTLQTFVVFPVAVRLNLTNTGGQAEVVTQHSPGIYFGSVLDCVERTSRHRRTQLFLVGSDLCQNVDGAAKGS